MLKTLFEEFRNRARTPHRSGIIAGYGAATAPSRARPLARQSGDGDISLAHAAQQAGLGKGNLAYRVRSCRNRASTMSVGDSFGMFPANDPALVDAIIKALAAPADFPIGGRTLREVLLDGVSLSPAPDMLFQLFSYITGGERRKKARALATGEDPDGDAATPRRACGDREIPRHPADPEAFIEALDPLQPRLYSISSSPKANPGRVALTVDAVRYDHRPSAAGSASLRPFSPSASRPARPSSVYVQKAHAFGLPADPATPIIMIGPGTGVAPVPRLPAGAQRHQGAGPQLAVLRPSALQLRLLLRGRIQGDEGLRRADAAVARLVARRRPEDLRAGPHARGRPRSVGAGSPTARTSMSAATPSAWPRTSRSRWSISSRSMARAAPKKRPLLSRELKKKGRYQQDVY